MRSKINKEDSAAGTQESKSDNEKTASFKQPGRIKRGLINFVKSLSYIHCTRQSLRTSAWQLFPQVGLAVSSHLYLCGFPSGPISLPPQGRSRVFFFPQSST